MRYLAVALLSSLLAAIAAIGALIATTVPRFDWREGEVEPTEG